MALHLLSCSIDDVGDLVVIAGGSVTLGGAPADVPITGLLGDATVSLRLTESFKAGARWELEHGDGQRVDLCHGDEIDLSRAVGGGFASQVTARVSAPDPSSSSIMLELEGAAVAVGAGRRLLLLAPGPGGRVTISGRMDVHLPAVGIENDVVLELVGGELAALRLSCVGGAAPSGRALSEDVRETSASVPLPIGSRVDLAFGAVPGRRPPFAIALRPGRG